MALDYKTLNTWQTPDLVFRDSRLVKKTRVMGMSQRAASIHIVALIVTSGSSLPINLAFCIWHAHRYGEVKKERTWIRQILGSRNMAYQGRGQWVNVNQTPNAAHHGNATPAGARCVDNNTSAGQAQPTHKANVNGTLSALASTCQIISFCETPTTSS